MKLSNEAKVGALVLASGALAVVFAWLLGIQNPFQKSFEFYVTYNFAGGIEVGSPVRVSGIKVGRVESIDFFQPANKKDVALSEPGSADADEAMEISPVRLKISVLKEATRGIKKDSRFYINLAGIIGERYIEVTPGTTKAEAVRGGETMAGVDPPRIDQLISQSFNLAGKISDLVERNKGDITKSIELLYKLSGNLNTTLKWVDQSGLFKTDFTLLMSNLIAISGDLKKLTAKTTSPEGEKTLKLINDLIWRLEPLDAKQVREFFQKEGIKTQIKMF